jgi:hypothetical protein
MITIDKNGVVMGVGYDIQVVDEQDEIGLIKIYVDGGYWYIGTEDRHEYEIYDVNTPDNQLGWTYI